MQLDSAVSLIPAKLLGAQVQQQLRLFTAELDSLMFLDDQNELAVDRKALLKILRNPKFFSTVDENLKDFILIETTKNLGRKVKERHGGKAVKWLEAVQFGLPIDRESIAQLQKLGISQTSTADDIKNILREQLPDLSDSWFDNDNETLANAMLENFRKNRSVWDCVVARLGIFIAIGVFAAVGAGIIVLTATGGIAAPLLVWLIGLLGAGNATVVANCIINPNLGRP
jgi:hypothetical protein